MAGMSERKTVSTQEAAELLGVSVATVKNRLKAGKLEGIEPSNKPRRPWRVFLDSLPQQQIARAEEDRQAQADHASEVAALRERIARLEGQLAERADQSKVVVEARQEAIELIRRVGHLEGQISAQRDELEHLRQQDTRFADVVARKLIALEQKDIATVPREQRGTGRPRRPAADDDYIRLPCVRHSQLRISITVTVFRETGLRRS